MCLPMRRHGELISYSDLLTHLAFALPIKRFSSQPLSFFTFSLCILSPTLSVGSDQAAAWGLVATQDATTTKRREST